MDILIQYDSPDDQGETRREYNARFNIPSPEYELHPDAQYLLEVFEYLSNFRHSGMNGPEPILPGTVLEWCRATGTMLCHEEIEQIFKVDAVYRKAYRIEQERQAEAARARGENPEPPQKPELIDG